MKVSKSNTNKSIVNNGESKKSWNNFKKLALGFCCIRSNSSPAQISSSSSKKDLSIRHLSSNQISEAADAMISDIRINWRPEYPDINEDTGEVIPLNTDQIKRNNRYKNTLSILSSVSDPSPDHDLFGYQEDDQWAGFLVMNNNDIESLVGHPNKNGVGKRLLTFAVNHSPNGIVTVSAPTENAKGFYKKFGFIQHSLVNPEITKTDPEKAIELILDPSKSNLWQKNKNGEWETIN